MTTQQTHMPFNQRQYKTTVAGQLFKHLGLQMYSGVVPAISEIISNAYDAMARNVWITIPTERSFRQNDTIEVRDDGHGMSFDECNSLYLFIGRDRRVSQSDRAIPYNALAPRKVPRTKRYRQTCWIRHCRLDRNSNCQRQRNCTFRMGFQ